MTTLGQEHPLLPCLGVGVGLRPPHYDTFLTAPPPDVSWVEVISENFLAWEDGSTGRPLQILEKIRTSFPVVLHGVSLNIGSTDPLNRSYLRRLRELIRRVEPAWVSDHLCWTGVEGQNTHDLLPLLYNDESLDLVCRRLLQVQHFLGRRIFIENPSSYVAYEHSTMSEWTFLAEMARRSDCGILLDINNVYVSSVNHGFDPIEYLSAVPVERVGQIHLAGHSKHEGYLIDTHDAPICPEVWALYRWAVKQFGEVNTMIERDDNIPAWPELAAELAILRRIQSESTEAKTVSPPVAATV